MRAVLLIALLAGCGSSDDSCSADSDCGGDVCARDGECLPASEIKAVKVVWTIGGAPADATSCASNPDFYLYFYGSLTYSFGYEPVPCMQGQFFIDKLPTAFDSVELGVEGGFRKVERIDNTNTASFDLSL